MLPTLYRNLLNSERTEAKGFEKKFVFPIKLVLITVLLLAIQFQLPLWVIQIGPASSPVPLRLDGGMPTKDKDKNGI